MRTTQKLAGGLVALLAVAILAFGANTYLRHTDLPPAPLTQAAAIPDQNLTGVEPAPEDASPVITFGTYEFYKDGYKPLVEAFQKEHPEITVQLVTLNDYGDPRKVASAADTMMLPELTGPHNYYLDLTPFQEGQRDFESDDFWPGVFDSCQDGDGRQYGLPAEVSPVGIFYAQKAFDEAGVAYPTSGWTWDDFRRMTGALTRSQGGQIRYGFADDAFINAADDTLATSQINGLLNQTAGEIDPQRFAQALQWYVDLVDAGQLYAANIYPETLVPGGDNKAWAKTWNENWEKWSDLFLKAQPAMWKGDLMQYSWVNAQMSASEDGTTMVTAGGPASVKEDGLGWVPFPVSSDGSSNATTPAHVSCLAVSSGTKHPQAAWAWINFLSHHPYIPDYSMAAPARRSVADAQGYWSRVPEQFRAALQFALEHGAYSRFYPNALMEVSRALLRSVQENVILAEALQGAKNQVAQAPLATPDAAPIEVAGPLPTAAPGTTIIEYANTGLKEESLQALADEFHRLHPDITVRVTSPMGDPGPASTAEDYDCFSWYSPQMADEIAPNQFDQVLSLDSFLNWPDMALREDFDPESLKQFTLADQQIGLPLSYLPTLIAYNADLLASQGIEPPGNNWDIQTALDKFQAATSGEGADHVYGVALSIQYGELGLLTGSRNLSLGDVNANPPAIHFDRPETRDFMQWSAGLVKEGVVLPAWIMREGETQENMNQVRQLIQDGKVAFWLDVPTSYGGKYQLTDPAFKVGRVPLPHMQGENSYRVSQIPRGQYISNRAENPQACWEWIKFISEHPEALYDVPARRSMLASPAWEAVVGKETADALRAAIAQRTPEGRQQPNELGSAGQWWTEILEAAFRGKDPLPLLAGAQQKADVFAACLAGSSSSYEDQAACFDQAQSSGSGQ